MEIKDVVLKLVGNINPIGETNTDNDRFENLKVMCELIESLIDEVDDMAQRNKSAHQFSMKRSSEYADKFIRELVN